MADKKTLTLTRNIDYKRLHKRIVEQEDFDDDEGLRGFRGAYEKAKERADDRTNAWFDQNIPGLKVD